MSDDPFTGADGADGAAPSNGAESEQPHSPPYKVGYGRPPRAHQYPKGRSGNPSGRPRKQKATPNVLAVLDEPVPVRVNGEFQEMHPKEVELRQHVKAALAGDLPALKYLIELFSKHGVLTPAADDQQSGGVVWLPITSMPWAMAFQMGQQFGLPPWSAAQIAKGRARYIAGRSALEAQIDDAIGYPDLMERTS